MTIKTLLNQLLTLRGKTGYNREGQEINTTDSSTVKARIEVKDMRRLLPNGSMVTINAVAFLPADTSIDTDDMVEYSGVQYKVFSKSEQIDGLGNVSHLELELMKWQASS